MSVITKDTIQPSSGQALTIKDEGGTASITVQTDGDLTLAENAYLGSGKGIYFDGQTTSANFLDDYEEGSWTPALGVNSGSASFSETAYGRYTKIGHRVIAEFYVNVTVSSSSGVLTRLILSTLPFTPKSETVLEDSLGGYLLRSNHKTDEQVILFNGTNPATTASGYFRNREGTSGNTIATQLYAGVLFYRV